jgi:hypothetical protein
VAPLTTVAEAPQRAALQEQAPVERPTAVRVVRRAARVAQRVAWVAAAQVVLLAAQVVAVASRARTQAFLTVACAQPTRATRVVPNALVVGTPTTSLLGRTARRPRVSH